MASNGAAGNGAYEPVLAAILEIRLFLEEWREEQVGASIEKLPSKTRGSGAAPCPQASFFVANPHPHELDKTLPPETPASPEPGSPAHLEKPVSPASEKPLRLESTSSGFSSGMLSGTPIALRQRLQLEANSKSFNSDFQDVAAPRRITSFSRRFPFRKLAGMLKEPPPPPTGCLKRWVALHNSFELLCSLVIICNAVFMAWSSNYDAKHFDKPQPTLFYGLELGFCGFYTLELSLRIYTLRCRYFLCPDWRWNVCDTVLVVTSLQEQLAILLTSGSGNANISFLRVLRLLKMVKVLRMVRLMRAFREFRMLFNSIAGSLKAAIWAFLLIVVMSFMFGLCILQGVTDFLKFTPDVSDFTRERVDAYWDSLSKSMISMYMSTTGGIDWNQVADVLYVVGGEYYVIFVIYIALYTCVVTNTITSLFVESTIAFAEKDTASIISDKLARQDEYVRKLRSWFTAIDTNQSGEITYDQFADNVNDPDVLAFAETLEIELVDLKQFFTVISCNGKRAVNLEAFVLGCIKLKGMAKSMDLMSLMYSHRDSTNEQKMMLSKFERKCMLEIDILKRCLEENSRDFVEQRSMHRLLSDTRSL